MKIGILGGTFDPVHKGHLLLAEEASRKLELSLVLFLPAGQPQLKDEQPVTAAEHRLQMLRLVTEGQPHYKISAMEIERKGPTYTFDTMTELRQKVQTAQRAAIIGGGFIGAEFADEFSHRSGTEVHLIEMMPKILFSAFDDEFCDDVANTLKSKSSQMTSKLWETLLLGIKNK